ncbi:hypothetical protein DFH11DRAFT_1556584 [Phellopilus nigrolimitatus]|nr:hypothetical protein DFH11DRAFT_1556584 [Phellopilus nigrolimitatus]
MLFTRAVSFLAFFATLGVFTSAKPSLSDRSSDSNTAAVSSVFTTLQSQTGSVLPQFSDLVASGNATSSTVTPLVNQLVSALNTAHGSLEAIPTGSTLVKRQSADAIATLVAGVVSDIANGLEPLIGVVPGLDVILIGLDTALDEVLVSVDVLVEGVVVLVSSALTDVSVILQGLGLGVVLGLLGLLGL